MTLPAGPVLDLRSRWSRFLNGLPEKGFLGCVLLAVFAAGGVCASFLIGLLRRNEEKGK